jgi:hypothetical protein
MRYIKALTLVSLLSLLQASTPAKEESKPVEASKPAEAPKAKKPAEKSKAAPAEPGQKTFHCKAYSGPPMIAFLTYWV